MIKLSMKALGFARRVAEEQAPSEPDKNLLDIQRQASAAPSEAGDVAISDENARFILDSIGTFLNRSNTIYPEVWDGNDIQFLTKVQDEVRRGLEQGT